MPNLHSDHPWFQLLVPPGDGVYTVSTGGNKKAELQKKMYSCTQENVSKSWRASLSKLDHSNLPLVLGICSDCGGGILRGANWGPLYIREQLLKQYSQSYLDLGDIRVIPHLLHDKYLNEKTLQECRQALFNNPRSALPVSPLSITEYICSELYQDLPMARLLSFGGDHSVSYPLTKAYFQNRKERKIKAALIHFDAHTDLLDKRLGIDLCFGSWTYHILPYLHGPDHVVQLGIRATGKDRSHWESSLGIKQIWANEIKQHGVEKVAKSVIDYLRKRNIEEIYISFDIDAIDEAYASATGTPESGGLAPHEASYLVKEISHKFPVTSADLVEVAPFIHHGKYNSLDPHPSQTTLETAGNIASLLLEALQK